MANTAANTETAANKFLNAEDERILRSGMCQKASPNEFALFVSTCNKTGLDPFMRQIYPMFRYNKQEGREIMQIQVSIDGMRLVAERSGKYAGQVGPFWCGVGGEWKDVWLDNTSFPVAAKVGVIRKDFQEVLWAVAKFNSYVQTGKDNRPNAMWVKLPDLMLAKCAEALALRKAFPMELSGLYSKEEMGQADNPTENRGSLNTSPNTAPAQKPGKIAEPTPEEKAAAEAAQERKRLTRTLVNILKAPEGLGLTNSEAVGFIKDKTGRADIKKMGDLTDKEIQKCLGAAREELSAREQEGR